jgi:GAF domain-containing protein
LIRDPRPLRLADVGSHPQSYGFPPGHPPMRSFLGVPILVGGAAWGNLYLTERADGPFGDDDEEAMVVLADWAALAITNARLYGEVRARSDRLAHANRGLTTTAEIARALAGETDLERVLELVVKRSRALTGARAALLALLDGEQLTIAAMAGEGLDAARVNGQVALADALAAVALRTRSVQRHDDVPASAVERREFGARSALIAPVGFRGRTLGALAMFDRHDAPDGRFRDEDAQLLEAFATTAAAAIATAQDVAADRLRRSMHAAEQERRRWAR